MIATAPIAMSISPSMMSWTSMSLNMLWLITINSPVKNAARLSQQRKNIKNQSFRQDFTIGSLEKKCGNKLEKCVILHHDP